MSRDTRDDAVSEIISHLQTFTAGFVIRTLQAADALSLAATDLVCMCLLQLHGPATPGWISEMTGLSTGAATGIVDRLERSGYASRSPDPQDRRRVIIRPDLLAFARDIQKHAPTQLPGMAEFYGNYSDTQLRTIRRFVADIAAATPPTLI